MLSKNNFEDVLHFPRLDTVLLVENFIKENSGEFKKRKLWENLPKGMMYQTYQVIFDYLEYSNKISKDSEGYIIWIYNSELVDYYLKNKDLEWKKK